jgi:hypothetical protein
MDQLGHASAALALEVYAKKLERNRDTGARVDELVRGADWAPMGTNGAEAPEPLPVEITQAAEARADIGPLRVGGDGIEPPTSCL